MSHTTSLVSISTDKVRVAVTAMLAAVQRGQQEERANSIALLTTYRRWWGLAAPFAEAQAIAIVDDLSLDRYGFRRPHTWWRISGWGTEALAKRLQSAADLSSDGAVWLNLDEAQQVKEYLP